jgi:hypothetical protein
LNVRCLSGIGSQISGGAFGRALQGRAAKPLGDPAALARDTWRLTPES